MQNPREHFIPIRKAELIERLAAHPKLTAEDRTHFQQLSELLGATFHFEYHERLERLKNAYTPFDPDADTMSDLLATSKGSKTSMELFQQVSSLLERANYRRLDRDAIEAALNGANHWGVRLAVDFDVFQQLVVYARGDTAATKTVRRWRQCWRALAIRIPIYKRLVVVFQLDDEKGSAERMAGDGIYLKMFKDIPCSDLETLLPGTKVKMSLLDQGRIVLPALSGVGITIYKVINGALALAFAGAYGIFAFLGLLGGTVGYGVKSFHGYVRARDKYRLNLTQNLYYQNLDNNAGVLYRLLDEAEEQESREAILAYFLLWQEADQRGWSENELDRRAERFLIAETGLEVDFEVDDALQKLVRLGLVQRNEQAAYVAVPIREALRRLDQAWDNFFPFSADSEEKLSRRAA